MNFLTTKLLSSKRLVHPKMSYVQERIRTNAHGAIDYYRNISRYISNDHLIVRLCRILLTQFPINKQMVTDPYLLKQQLNEFAERNSTLLGIGTNYKRGSLQEVFYDRDYLYFKEIEDITIQEGNWTEYPAITVTSHPRTDISFKIPEPVDCQVEDGLATIEIDLYKLLLMLRGFHNQQATEDSRGIDYTLFYTRYLIPNMIPSHLDVAWVNRVRAVLIGQPRAKEIKLVGLTLPTGYTYLDNVAEDLITTFQRDSYTVADILKSFPAIFKTSLYDMYKYTNEQPTSTGRAYVMLSRYRMLSFLLDVTDQNPSRSKLQLTEMGQFIRTCTSYRVLGSINILESEENELNAEVVVPLINLGYKLKLF